MLVISPGRRSRTNFLAGGNSRPPAQILQKTRRKNTAAGNRAGGIKVLTESSNIPAPCSGPPEAVAKNPGKKEPAQDVFIKKTHFHM